MGDTFIGCRWLMLLSLTSAMTTVAAEHSDEFGKFGLTNSFGNFFQMIAGLSFKSFSFMNSFGHSIGVTTTTLT